MNLARRNESKGWGTIDTKILTQILSYVPLCDQSRFEIATVCRMWGNLVKRIGPMYLVISGVSRHLRGNCCEEWNQVRILSFERASILPKEIPDLCRMWKDFYFLSSLDLSSNGLDDEAVRLLVESLTTLPVQVLNLADNNISWLSCEEISQLLFLPKEPRKCSIQKLDLSDNNIGPKGCDSLSNVLRQHTCALRELRLACCGVGCAGARSIASGLRSNRSLRLLTLSRNNIGDGGGSDILGASTGNLWLRTLDLQFNFLTDACVEASVAAVSCDHIKNLRLGGNDELIHVAGMKLMSATGACESNLDVGVEDKVQNGSMLHSKSQTHTQTQCEAPTQPKPEKESPVHSQSHSHSQPLSQPHSQSHSRLQSHSSSQLHSQSQAQSQSQSHLYSQAQSQSQSHLYSQAQSQS
eukprot:Rmarinus@m.13456